MLQVIFPAEKRSVRRLKEHAREAEGSRGGHFARGGGGVGNERGGSGEELDPTKRELGQKVTARKTFT